jgi:hypothetical protein
MCAKATTAFVRAQWYSSGFPTEEEAKLRTIQPVLVHREEPFLEL